ncbi:MAG: SdpI family protein [Paludibacter sp.]|nr:SdpI family protein [Paludibacter sp.]
MNKYLKESIFWILILLPLAYLATIWKNLPAQVATHFDLQGNPNGWSSKNSLIYMIGGLGIGTYILMLLIPKYDPKKKIEQMGKKYYTLRIVLTLFMAVISCYILYSASGSKLSSNTLLMLIGALFATMGNYMQTVKPNYFIGIKTPWTLESEDVWRKTHKFGGRLWLIGGLIIIILSLIFKEGHILGISFIIITVIISLVPVIYSYIDFKRTQSSR